MDERASAPGRGRRFARVLLPLLLAALALAAWMSWTRPGEAHRRPSPGGDVAAAAPDLGGAPEPSSGDDAPLEALPPAVRRYLERTEYPPSSGPLTERHEDLLHPNRRFERLHPIPATRSDIPSEVVHVRLTADRWEYIGDDVAELLLEARRASAAHEIRIVEAAARREGRAGAIGEPVPIRFARRGDHYESDLLLNQFADHHGPIVVDVRIEYEPGGFHDESLRLLLTPEGRIPARFTGAVKDRVDAGGLRVEVGLDVEQPGFYRIDANLYSAAGIPVAFATYKGDLERNARTVPLDFFGKVLRDSAAPGPYQVGEIRGYRFIDGGYPDRERIPDLPGRFSTAGHALSSFSDEVWDHPDKQQMVELLLADFHNGISIDLPPEPGDAPAPEPASGR